MRTPTSALITLFILGIIQLLGFINWIIFIPNYSVPTIKLFSHGASEGFLTVVLFGGAYAIWQKKFNYSFQFFLACGALLSKGLLSLILGIWNEYEKANFSVSIILTGIAIWLILMNFRDTADLPRIFIGFLVYAVLVVFGLFI